ncbi:uncharacterized protein LOC144115282 isoform X1 [Amblyomma americanum]
MPWHCTIDEPRRRADENSAPGGSGTLTGQSGLLYCLDTGCIHLLFRDGEGYIRTLDRIQKDAVFLKRATTTVLSREAASLVTAQEGDSRRQGGGFVEGTQVKIDALTGIVDTHSWIQDAIKAMKDI